MTTAQEAFKAMLRDHVAPGLRGLGFTGSGQRYTLANETHWVLLAFQRSVRSDATRVKFTVNYFVVARAEWAERRVTLDAPERPRAGVDGGTRISDPITRDEVNAGRRAQGMEPLPDLPDVVGFRSRWWELFVGDDPETMSTEVVAAIRDDVLPAVRAQISPPQSD